MHFDLAYDYLTMQGGMLCVYLLYVIVLMCNSLTATIYVAYQAILSVIFYFFIKLYKKSAAKMIYKTLLQIYKVYCIFASWQTAPITRANVLG